ncbi:MurR/RpiR family transcriptional regulator [Lacticaseibacillus sharpeae]|uniref:MurR/RpiR family transcriptional regulator n=1 Tax=Lacticaseibacillus sharpeae TaxID=1626 RepID=UPI0006D0BDD6|nr:MurR/RpiR family transcriptional regulator [Lacticaseibacillus sharpeae]
MLIAEKLRAAVGYTPTDVALAATVLADPRAVPGLSMQELADRAHCSHSAVVRLCKKLGFKGYREFTIALIQELNAQTVTIDDANFPFSARDTLREATDKLATLSIGAITNTKERLNMPALVTAVQTLIHARRIFLYGHGDSSLLVQEFANKLNKIDIYPILADQLGESGGIQPTLRWTTVS